MPLQTGDAAPNFDLTSTEDVLLMLRDELARTAVVLYLFRDEANARVRGDLAALAAAAPALAKRRARLLAVSRLAMPELKKLQLELKLPFPLLRDDRDFCSAYDLPAVEEGAAPAGPALLLIGRDQKIRWRSCPAPAAAEAIGAIREALEAQAPLAASYPRAVVNSFVSRLVHRARKWPAAPGSAPAR